MFTKENCVRSMYEAVEGDSNAGCVGIIKEEWFKAEARTPENQLFRLGGGFGVSPSKMGNACIGYFCADGEECRVERYDFIGIADEETTKYAEQLEAKWKVYTVVDLRVIDKNYGDVLTCSVENTTAENAVNLLIDKLSNTQYCEDEEDLKLNYLVREMLQNGSYTFYPADELSNSEIVMYV